MTMLTVSIRNFANEPKNCVNFWNSFRTLKSLKMNSITETFAYYQLNGLFLYSSTICTLHYDPQHVSSSTLLILRRTNCITTASGIVTVCKQPYSMQVTVRLFTEGDDTRGCSNTICPPEDEQGAARNMLRIVV